MNNVALLRNLSQSNVYDVAQQHSDDEEYDDEGNPLATVFEDAINDNNDGGGSALRSLLQLSLLQLSLQTACTPAKLVMLCVTTKF